MAMEDDATCPSHVCPVCTASFRDDAPTKFALHVLACTTQPKALAAAATTTSNSSDTALSACAMCHHVYVAATSAQEIEFHEFECARVNDVMPVEKKHKSRASASDHVGASNGNDSGNGAAESEDAAPSTPPGAHVRTLPAVFPATCFMCESSGRQMLHCKGACARSFHPACVGVAMTSQRDKALMDSWQCAECFRGVHTCAKCGFLGVHGVDMAKCSVVDCGWFFHSQCNPVATSTTSSRAAMPPFVCPRHTCQTCHAVETDMTKCRSCLHCPTATHLAPCQPSNSAATAAGDNLANGGLDTHFFVCSAHNDDDHVTANSDSKEKKSSKKHKAKKTLATHVSLKQLLQTGDIVLVLELDNSLLPPKCVSVTSAWNQWGIVRSIEGIDTANQLLGVELFADGSTITVTNRYVLPLAPLTAFRSPERMLRDLVQQHTIVELNVRHAAGEAVLTSTPTRAAALGASVLAFKARVEDMHLLMAQLHTDTDEGWKQWEGVMKSHQGRALRYGVDTDNVLPIHAFLDTRCKAKRAQSAAKAPTPRTTNGAPSSSSSSSSFQGPGSHRDGGSSASANSTSLSRAGTSSGLHASDGQPSDAANKMSTTTKCTDCGRREDRDTVAQVVRKLCAQRRPDRARAVALNNLQRFQATWELLALDPTSCLQDMQDDGSSAKTKGSPFTTTKLTHPLLAGVEITTTEMAQHMMAQPVIVATALDTSDVAQPEEENDINDPTTNKTRQTDTALATETTATTTTASTATVATALPQSSTFSRAKTARSATTEDKPWQVKRQRVAAETPAVVRQVLEERVSNFLQGHGQTVGAHLQHRPAFFRPTVVISRVRGIGHLRGVSRILLSQDKRTVKCFVRSTDPPHCPHEGNGTAITTGERDAFLTLDLMSVSSSLELMHAIRGQLLAALDQDTVMGGQDTCGLDAALVQRWLASATAEQSKARLPISVYSCCYDGSRRRVDPVKEDWLCFCTNVCHLSVVLQTPLATTTATQGSNSANQQS